MVGALPARADALHLRGNAAYRILSLPRWRNGPHGRSRARAATGRSPRNHATSGSVHVRTETREAGSRSAAGGRVPARPPGCPELLAGLAAAVASRLRRAADADPLMRRTVRANPHGGPPGQVPVKCPGGSSGPLSTTFPYAPGKSRGCPGAHKRSATPPALVCSSRLNPLPAPRPASLNFLPASAQHRGSRNIVDAELCRHAVVGTSKDRSLSGTGLI